MPTLMDLETEYIKKHPKSQQLYERGLTCYPSGVSHDARFTRPFPVYAVRAKGTKKWDMDGNEYVDYVMGHGALLFGYGDERVTAAFQDQVDKALHMGACTDLEVEWAELIQKLVPCAQKGLVRATSCGTEANLMAIRLARMYTGKDKVVLHAGSYHGKGDTTIYAGRGPPFGVTNVRGIPQGVKNDVLIVPYNNLRAVEKMFKTGDIACVVLQGNALYTRGYMKGLRELSTQYGVVFMMDEVVSGFRYAAGGAQEYYGVIPDVAALGKVIGGGAPIGAICGKKEIMDLFSFKDAYWNKFIRASVGGTWNAQPLSIVGGIASLKIIESEGDTLYQRLYRIGRRLVDSFNELAKDRGVAALAFGLPIENPTNLSINLFNRPVPGDQLYLWQTGPTSFNDYRVKAGFSARGQANYAMYLSMMNQGIFSYRGRGGSLCIKYTEDDLEKTESAFEITLNILHENRLVGRGD